MYAMDLTLGNMLTNRIAVKAARLSLAKIPTDGRHAEKLSVALAALDGLWDAISGEDGARCLDDDGPDFEDAADFDYPSDDDAFEDHVEEIMGGVECDEDPLSEADVMVSTGAY